MNKISDECSLIVFPSKGEIKMENILMFDGKSTYIEIPDLDSPANERGAITVEFWNFVRPDQSSQTTAFMFGAEDQTDNRVSCHAPWFGTLYWDCGNWGIKERVSVDYKPYFDIPTHIALVSTGTQAGDQYNAVYINGKFIKQSVLKSGSRGLKGLLIGAMNGKNGVKSQYHHGMIDKFLVWSEARTESQIRQDMYTDPIGYQNLRVFFDLAFEGNPTELKNKANDTLPGKLNNFTFPNSQPEPEIIRYTNISDSPAFLHIHPNYKDSAADQQIVPGATFDLSSSEASIDTTVLSIQAFTPSAIADDAFDQFDLKTYKLTIERIRYVMICSK